MSLICLNELYPSDIIYHSVNEPGGLRAGTGVRKVLCSYRGVELGSLHPGGISQLSVTLAPGSPHAYAQKPHSRVHTHTVENNNNKIMDSSPHTGGVSQLVGCPPSVWIRVLWFVLRGRRIRSSSVSLAT